MSLESRLMALAQTVAADVKSLFTSKQNTIGYTPYDAANPNGYTANSSDVALLHRANHTGKMSIDVLEESDTGKVFTNIERNALAQIDNKLFSKIEKSITLSGIDLNTLVTSGFYRMVADTINAFSPAMDGQVIVVRGLDTVVQIALSYSGSNRMYKRGTVLSGNTPNGWTAWTTVAETGPNTWAGDQTFNANKLIKPVLSNTVERKTTTAIVGNNLVIDFTYGLINVPLNSNILTFSFLNYVTDLNTVQSIMIELAHDGTQRSIVWPTGNGINTLKWNWNDGKAPTSLSTVSGKRDTLVIKTSSQFLWDVYLLGTSQ